MENNVILCQLIDYNNNNRIKYTNGNNIIAEKKNTCYVCICKNILKMTYNVK